jgi:RHS repeat-associated protein
LTADHLGSPRIITDASGNVTSRKDFAAFGDETLTAQRTSGLGYQPDTVRQDYTGYQKDDESGLEYAQARYYNSAHGRFTSVDPLTASASIRDPQTFNRYSYVLNSPYKFTDPLGLLPVSIACAQWCTEAGYVDGSAFRGREANGLTNADVVPTFDWNQLSPNEQRIFNNSSLTVEMNGKKQTVRGQELFNYLAAGTPIQQRQLAGTLNQTRQLETTTFQDADGNDVVDNDGNPVTAISLVTNITFSDRDRIFVNADPRLRALVKNDSRFESVPGHEGFPDSYKDSSHEYAGLQLSFSKDGTQTDVDSDIHNSTFSKKAFARHASEVVGNKLLNHKTNPYVIYRKLLERGNGQIFKPNYDLP